MIFAEYKRRMNRQFDNHDIRERVFQENVIRPFLQEILSEVEIEPVDIKISGTSHNYRKYCGCYRNQRGEWVPGTPDLCIADRWEWENDTYPVRYLGVVEVKSPALQPLTGIAPESYPFLEEIKMHLTAEENEKVMATDGVTWTFYEKTKGILPIHTIALGELKYRRKTYENSRGGLERNAGGRPIVDKITWFAESDETGLYQELIRFIREFILQEH